MLRSIAELCAPPFVGVILVVAGLIFLSISNAAGSTDFSGTWVLDLHSSSSPDAMLKRLGVPWIERNLAATIQLKSTYTQSMLLPVTVLAATAQNLGAQDIEPRAHTNIPVGISMGRGVWGALDADYYIGGQTTRDGVTSDNSQVNWRLGATLAFPVDRRNSIKLFGSTGVYSRTGSNFSSVGIAWQYRWGRGL